MFDPDTIIRVAAVIWVVMAIGWAGFRLVFRWLWKRGKVKITLPDEKK